MNIEYNNGDMHSPGGGTVTKTFGGGNLDKFLTYDRPDSSFIAIVVDLLLRNITS